MEGVKRYSVRLLPHNPAWEAEFCRVHDLLREIWGGNLIRAEHVGSTAIPSIPAKPVLDAAVMLKSVEDMDAQALVSLGYEDCGYQNEERSRRLFVLRGENEISLQHIHCYGENDPDFYRQVFFRDYLNSHPAAAREYAKLKQRLAERFADDRASYTRGKAEFVKSILRLGEN